MIFTHLVSSHGEQVCSLSKETVITNTLPDNVVVIMNCNNSCIQASDVIDAKLWELASSFKAINDIKKLDKIKTIEEMNNVFINYTKALNKGLNTLEYTKDKFKNEYCFFFNEYPDVEFCSELQKFRSGIYTLPVSITYETRTRNNINIPSRGVLTEKDFADYENLPYNQRFKSDILLSFLNPERNKTIDIYGNESKKYKYIIESYGTSTKDTILAKSDLSRKKLSHLIEDLNYHLGDNLFHVIILATCTVGPKDQKEMRHHFSQLQDKPSFLESTTKLFQAKIAKFIINHVNKQCEVPFNLLEFIEEKDVVEYNTNDDMSKILTKQLSNSRNALRKAVDKSSCACSRKTTVNAETSTNASNAKNTEINTYISNSADLYNSLNNANNNFTSIRPSFLKGISNNENEKVFNEIRSYYKSIGHNINVELMDKMNYNASLPIIIPIDIKNNQAKIEKIQNDWITVYNDARLLKKVQFTTEELGFSNNEIVNFETITGNTINGITESTIRWVKPGHLDNAYSRDGTWEEETLTLKFPQQAGNKKISKSKVVININKKQYVIKEDKGKPYICKNKQQIYLKDLKKFKS